MFEFDVSKNHISMLFKTKGIYDKNDKNDKNVQSNLALNKPKQSTKIRVKTLGFIPKEPTLFFNFLKNYQKTAFLESKLKILK